MEAQPQGEIERFLATSASSQYWLITRCGHGQMEVLTMGRGGEEILPVFSFEEEASDFLRSVGEEGWKVRHTGVGELISVLCGPCAGVKRVALDPSEEVTSLVSLGRRNFMDLLMGSGSSRLNEMRDRERSDARRSRMTSLNSCS